MIEYKRYDETTKEIPFAKGFFKGWPNPPSEKTHRRVLENSYRVFVAVDREKNEIVGFINAISDGILTCYIPLLEVVEGYQGKRIGQELAKHMLNELQEFYMVDLTCDNEKQPFYEELGMYKSFGMVQRNFHNQQGVGPKQ
ncbi:GNAT family N-acetyltransferase [Isachenkonia alkalipeptolytica]|uniref:GNAT family N-acetyltransferase n=1 Tax=Isachenkonia alkalipeptolytica TaxID=2565777 RepID=A0AA43XM58_9CLOT|nr:GNAT family N-acetyltransferase [Isachenkonia alkalipeptolytica]NBG89378.1 GNAT family N-acetyltransferase [Isachenkonia alkalipeptolytica]